ncbi:MAG: hypothetical protein EOO17_02595 [Chloroflexi bacterium]|nr:MAG: hypothetical protein EOO17_02595 [Chloroflexota bacterium]
MNQHIQTTKEYIKKYKIEFIIGLAVFVVVAAATAGIVYAARSSTPKVVYQPAKACELLTLTEAKELLGERTLASGAKAPSVSGHVATSSCGYTDGNPDTGNLVVAAITVRSGIDDKGVQQNETEFSDGKPTDGIDDVKDLGSAAYFNQRNGQLNVLDGRDWIVLSYGPGASPEANVLDQAILLAKKVVR